MVDPVRGGDDGDHGPAQVRRSGPTTKSTRCAKPLSAWHLLGNLRLSSDHGRGGAWLPFRRPSDPAFRAVDVGTVSDERQICRGGNKCSLTPSLFCSSSRSCLDCTGSCSTGTGRRRTRSLYSRASCFMAGGIGGSRFAHIF